MLQDDALHRATTSQANLMSGKIDRPFAFSESMDVKVGKFRAQAEPKSGAHAVTSKPAGHRMNGGPASTRWRGHH
jgi:hypothetical protein